MSGTRIKANRSAPLKALPPITSNLIPLQYGASITPSFSSAFSPPTRHISPEHAAGPIIYKGKVINQTDTTMRRTASLDALTLNNHSIVSIPCTFLQLDKATQTEETSFTDRNFKVGTPTESGGGDSPSEIKMEEVIKRRLQQRYTPRGGEHSVSSQTLSPVHSKANPVSIPTRTVQPIHHMRPMRSSVEGLNQEIEKLVLHPSAGTIHSCRQELEMFSRGTPEGHRAPITDLFHPVGEHTRSVNTQTPSGDMSSDSQSTSPDDGVQSKDASPRINRFLAREPPDGCEKVNLNLKQQNETEPGVTTHFKPASGFQLRPSLGSAFQPIPIVAKPRAASEEIANSATGDETLTE